MTRTTSYVIQSNSGNGWEDEFPFTQGHRRGQEARMCFADIVHDPILWSNNGKRKWRLVKRYTEDKVQSEEWEI